MPRRLSALSAASAAFALLALSACSPAAPTPTPVPTAPDRGPEPTEFAMIVGPGEKPPTVFGGDCDAVLTADEIAATAGQGAEVYAESTGDVGNVGGLLCAWSGPTGATTVEILPLGALGDAALSEDDRKYYFEDCDPNWVCSWSTQTDTLWIATSFQFVPDMTRESVDEWGAQLAGAIDRRFRESPSEPWERDTAGWWPVLDCAALADGVGTALGDTFVGESTGYPDPPHPGVVLAALASHHASCLLTGPDPAVMPIEVTASAGEAWMLPAFADDEPLDTGVAGITAWSNSGHESVSSQSYSLTDGVNALWLNAPSTGPWAASEILKAVAGVAASGF